MTEHDIHLTVTHHPDQAMSEVAISSGGQTATKIISDWLCVCGKSHRVTEARVLLAGTMSDASQ